MLVNQTYIVNIVILHVKIGIFLLHQGWKATQWKSGWKERTGISDEPSWGITARKEERSWDCWTAVGSERWTDAIMSSAFWWPEWTEKG